MKKGALSRRRFLSLGAGGAVALAAAASLSGDNEGAVRTGRGCGGQHDTSLSPDAGTRPAPASGQDRTGRRDIPFFLGLASYTFREFGLDDAIKMTKRAGLSRICLKDMHLPLESTPGQIAGTIAKVRAAGLIPYGCGVVYMKTAAEVERAFAYAKTAGFEVIIGVPDPGLLPLVDKRVRESGIRLAIHNHGPGDLLYPTPSTVYDRVKGLDPMVGLCLDIGHAIRAGVDPAAAAEACGPRLLDVHLKDETAAAAEGEPIEAGRGVIDLPRFLRTLVKLGFRGTTSFEYEKDGRDPLPGLAESVGYVRGILASL